MEVNTLNLESPASDVKRSISEKSFGSNSLRSKTIVAFPLEETVNYVYDRCVTILINNLTNCNSYSDSVHGQMRVLVHVHGRLRTTGLLVLVL